KVFLLAGIREPIVLAAIAAERLVVVRELALVEIREPAYRTSVGILLVTPRAPLHVEPETIPLDGAAKAAVHVEVADRVLCGRRLRQPRAAVAIEEAVVEVAREV